MSVRSKRHQHQQPHLMRMSVQASRRSPTGGCVTLKKTALDILKHFFPRTPSLDLTSEQQ